MCLKVYIVNVIVYVRLNTELYDNIIILIIIPNREK
jgi:hypothetical protein